MLEWSDAEKAIQSATNTVEAMPADPRLTEAVVLLGQARGRVADYIDGIPDEPNLADMPIAWRHDGDPIPEDELSDDYPYDEMFKFSWVDITRMFPSKEFVRGYLAATSDNLQLSRINIAAFVQREGSQKKAAAKFGISPQYLSDILKGNREIPDRVARFFGVRRVVRYEKLPDA